MNYLIDQFDNNILPKESDVFSVAPPLDGSNALLPALIDDPDVMPPDYFEGDGDNTVVLVDNVRDENFFDTEQPEHVLVRRGLLRSTSTASTSTAT